MDRKDFIRNSILISSGCIIAPTDKMTGFYNDFFPTSFIHHEFKEDIIQFTPLR